MRSILVLVVALLLSMAGPYCEAAKVTPLEKVLEMLYAMTEKGEKAVKYETVRYKEFMAEAKAMIIELNLNIEHAKDNIEELEALIVNTEAIIEDLDNVISKTEAERAESEKIRKEKVDQRAKQRAENMEMRVDAQESVDALKRAIQSLGSRDRDYEQGVTVGTYNRFKLLQKMADDDPKLRTVLDGYSLLQVDETLKPLIIEPEEGEVNAPIADAYEFQSDKILETLKSLLTKFSDELESVMATETKQARSAELEIQHLTNSIDALSAEIEKDSVLKGQKVAELAAAKVKLAKYQKDMAADEKTLSDLKATLELKTSAYKENQQVRQAELQAIRQATDVVAGTKVNRNYKKNINLNQKPIALLQVRSAHSRVIARQHAASVLKERAKALSSNALSNVADELASNPFAKVIDMISGMLEKMKADAEAEAEHKAWCDKNLAKNEKKRKKFKSEVDILEATIADQEATIATNLKTMAELAKEISKIKKDLMALAKERRKEKAENRATIADAEAGEAATKEALKILNDFYAGQSLMQIRSGQPIDAPKISEYKGMQDVKGGVVGMLEVIMSDFSRLLTDTTAAEKAAVAEFKQNNQDLYDLQMEKESEEHELKLANDRLEWNRDQDLKSLRYVSKDYKKALEIYDTLKGQCVEEKVSYAERAEQREAEIAALREAYDTLNSKEYFGDNHEDYAPDRDPEDLKLCKPEDMLPMVEKMPGYCKDLSNPMSMKSLIKAIIEKPTDPNLNAQMKNVGVSDLCPCLKTDAGITEADAKLFEHCKVMPFSPASLYEFWDSCNSDEGPPPEWGFLQANTVGVVKNSTSSSKQDDSIPATAEMAEQALA